MKNKVLGGLFFAACIIAIIYLLYIGTPTHSDKQPLLNNKQNNQQPIAVLPSLSTPTPAAVATSATPTTVTLTTEEKINKILDTLAPDQKSALEEKIEKQSEASKNPLSIALYGPNYILPFYYTGSPYSEIYEHTTPGDQKIMRSEFKAQLSLLMPIIPRLFNPNLSLDIAYTQLSYWQIYAASQYFRETNYEPEIFVEDHFHHNWLLRAGLNHQSNGRGGEFERSWNRAFAAVQFSGNNWLIGLKAWDLIFKKESSNLHNPHIAYYLGYENLLFAYQIHQATLSLQLQNVESALRRGFVEATLSYPLSHHISIYTQYFNGFGQSLIEYDHRTQSAGIGIAVNDWI